MFSNIVNVLSRGLDLTSTASGRDALNVGRRLGRQTCYGYRLLRAGASIVKAMDPIPKGLREQNKLEKRQRIRAAARELFSKHGYESATLRQIAKRAHVGLGTLFNYAQDKRDLVFLIFNEELDAVTTRALSAGQLHRSLLHGLIDIYKPHYEYFSENPALSRILLKELTFYSEGKQAATFQRIRHRLISGIEELVQACQKEGSIRSEEEPEMVARHIFFVCSGAIRWWIASLTPDPRQGLAELRRLLELQIKGLNTGPRTSGESRNLGTSSGRVALTTAQNGNAGRRMRAQRPRLPARRHA
jgi:AcrR family transcriptional regulator